MGALQRTGTPMTDRIPNRPTSTLTPKTDQRDKIGSREALFHMAEELLQSHTDNPRGSKGGATYT